MSERKGHSRNTWCCLQCARWEEPSTNRSLCRQKKRQKDKRLRDTWQERGDKAGTLTMHLQSQNLLGLHWQAIPISNSSHQMRALAKLIQGRPLCQVLGTLPWSGREDISTVPLETADGGRITKAMQGVCREGQCCRSRRRAGGGRTGRCSTQWIPRWHPHKECLRVYIFMWKKKFRLSILFWGPKFRSRVLATNARLRSKVYRT